MEEVKCLLVLKSVGEATALKHNKFKLNGNKPIVDVEKFLRKQLNHEKALYLYCGSGFAPTPDQLIKDLYECFQINGELMIFYGYQETWG
jgi:ubiquitin-like protein ATG12